MIDQEILRGAEAHLRRRDKKLARLIEAHGPCTLGERRRDPFHVLCCAIIGQQLSSRAADTIESRVAAAAGARARFRPAHFLEMAPESLRLCGLSNAKARWLKALAEACAGDPAYFRKLRRMDDTDAIEALDALPGIGRWTAEMFLIFALDRLDIFSLGDAGLRRGLNRIHNGGEKLDDDASLVITAKWAPYRSVGSWYLWRAADTKALPTEV
ncbi:MAG: DNA-3-methyladenine glycosylase 2 family protein [Nevskia sp.]|nr:DNA-3-methyladenine glycosylase 2 family protein [Nevskia sp.]